MSSRLQLYTGPHCELCDTAKDLIDRTLPAGSYELAVIDLSNSDLQTKKMYGLRIPVLCKLNKKDEELAWPFTPEQLLSFVQGRACE